MYGTTIPAGDNGVVYQLAGSGSEWTETVLYTFSFDFYTSSVGGVILDNAGNFYGTTFQGDSGAGNVFKLTYSTGSGWTAQVLYDFRGGNDGGLPYAGLIFDSAGNLYGATTYGGEGGGGTVFELTPSGSGWNYAVLYSFTGKPSACGPWGPLYMDAAGNLYGTTYCDGANGKGNIFKLTRSNGGWTYTSLHDFSIDTHEGGNPIGAVIMDSQGNLYGTTSSGGTGCRYNNCGVVWEITP